MNLPLAIPGNSCISTHHFLWYCCFYNSCCCCICCKFCWCCCLLRKHVSFHRFLVFSFLVFFILTGLKHIQRKISEKKISNNKQFLSTKDRRFLFYFYTTYILFSFLFYLFQWLFFSFFHIIFLFYYSLLR